MRALLLIAITFTCMLVMIALLQVQILMLQRKYWKEEEGGTNGKK